MQKSSRVIAGLCAAFSLWAGVAAIGAAASGVFVTDVRVWSTPRFARIVIHLDGHASFVYKRLYSPDRIYVDIQGVSLRGALSPGPIREDGVLKGVRVGLNAPSIPRIVLDLKAVESYKVFSLRSPERIVVDIEAPPEPAAKRPEAAAQAASPAPGRGSDGAPPAALNPKAASARPPSSASSPSETAVAPRLPTPETGPRPQRGKDKPPEAAPREASLAERFRRGFGKIVLDPGHGGKDPGAVGAGGVYEKDLVLDIALKLAHTLRRDLRAEVLLTRTRDVFLPLEERTAFANTHQADLFISIHVNSAPSGSLHGIETYLLSEATDERALKVAARENGVRVEELNDLQIILNDLSRRGQINRSVPLAEAVQEGMIAHLTRRYSRVRDLGVKQAPFYVLLGARMPSILVEVGFLSNRLGQRRLTSARYRQALAFSISRGVQKFIEGTQIAKRVDGTQ
ncbi:MAG: N-acetylmuramoyl-L-alanine amidase [Candidatus Tectomicrobia bacterium]|nr:N-acetylmuramoyl-L-alanine amidase [Candidatus Tectomicrobia bacterium]